MIISVNDPNSFWQSELVSFLGLASQRGIGYWTLRNLRSHNNSYHAILSKNNYIQILKQAGAKLSKDQLENFSCDILLAQGQRQLRSLDEKGIRLIFSGQDNYPQSLQSLDDPPYWLFIKGDSKLLSQPSVGIVGTRTPSSDGIFLATFVGGCLSSLKCPTVSGLANGIDQIIHNSSLRYNVPSIAILGTGILRTFPQGSELLKDDIVNKGGALVSEYLPNDTYSAENFVRRNRIQAAISRVLIPIEWTSNGGTAHTVRFAHQTSTQILTLRLPDWPRSRPELDMASRMGALLFTIPGQENEFRTTVETLLNLKEKDIITNAKQMPMLLEDNDN